MTPNNQAPILRNLQSQIRRIETSRCHPKRLEGVSSGFENLDRLLPERGFSGGTLIEWIGTSEGQGGMTLALAIAGRVVRSGGMIALISDRQMLFPPAMAGLGVSLERTVVVRPGDAGSGLWAWEQALRCEAFAVTLGWIEAASDTAMRRFQLAVEAGGGLGFLVRPAGIRSDSAWAELRFSVKALPSPAVAESWRWQAELLRCRGGFVGSGTAEIEVSHAHEADDMRVASELARPARSPRDSK